MLNIPHEIHFEIKVYVDVCGEGYISIFLCLSCGGSAHVSASLVCWFFMCEKEIVPLRLLSFSPSLPCFRGKERKENAFVLCSCAQL